MEYCFPYSFNHLAITIISYLLEQSVVHPIALDSAAVKKTLLVPKGVDADAPELAPKEAFNVKHNQMTFNN